MNVVKSYEIEHRNDFSLLCNWRKLHRALEIGIDRADFSVEFLRAWRGHTWVGVDPYAPYGQMPFNRGYDAQLATTRLAEFHTIVRLVRSTSEEFAASLDIVDPACKLPNFQPDFVYLDGLHDYESVKLDIKTWWARLSPFGIIGGHDYGEHHPGVTQAVNEFSDLEGIEIQLTHDFPTSWYAYKTPITSEWKRLSI